MDKIKNDIVTTPDELRDLVKGGYFFNFCIAFALNKGYRNAIKEKQKVEFNVGDYQVRFVPSKMCFELTNKVYFARIIHAYPEEVIYIGDKEEEVISDLLIELEKELSEKEPQKKFGLLPEFLYEDDGKVLIGRHGDSEITEEWIELKKKHKLDLADAQFIGYAHGRREPGIIGLVESMGLTHEEWEKWKTEYTATYLTRSERQEIDDHFFNKK